MDQSQKETKYILKKKDPKKKGVQQNFLLQF